MAVQYTLEGDLQADTSDEDDLDGAHFVWTLTIDEITDTLGSNTKTGSTSAWWGGLSSVNITSRPNAAPPLVSDVLPIPENPTIQYVVATNNYWQSTPQPDFTDHLQFFGGLVEGLPNLQILNYAALFDITFFPGTTAAALPLTLPITSQEVSGWAHVATSGFVSSYYAVLNPALAVATV